MKPWQFSVVLLLALVALGMSLAIVVTARGNVQLQETLQARQVQLNGSILGPQAQQVASGILQDMARVALTNEAMRQLLARHGYTVTPAPAATAPAAAAPAPKTEAKP